MFDEPRKGTEAHRVKVEVEKRQKDAQNKSLDKLFSETYHDCIDGYKYWFKDERNKKYVHPAVSLVKEGKAKDRKGHDAKFIEFKFEDRLYRITEYEWSFSEMNYYSRGLELDLFQNAQLVFGIGESVQSDDYSTTYRPSEVSAFVNENWVEDFRAIQAHSKKVHDDDRIRRAEDPAKTASLKEAFGITHLPEESVQEEAKVEQQSAAMTPTPQKKPLWKSVWFWVIAIIILAALFG